VKIVGAGLVPARTGDHKGRPYLGVLVVVLYNVRRMGVQRMFVEVRDMRDDSFRIIFPKFSRWIELSANEMYSLPCLSLEDFKKLFSNKVRPLPEDEFKSFLQNLSNEQLEELRDAMAGNIAPGNVKIYR
jgi:hypothetical protein